MESPSGASTGQVRDLHGNHFISKVFPLLEQADQRVRHTAHRCFLQWNVETPVRSN